MAYDTPIPGYDGPIISLFRLWKSEAAESFDFQAFSGGDYYRAVQEKVISERPSRRSFLPLMKLHHKETSGWSNSTFCLMLAAGYDTNSRAPAQPSHHISRRSSSTIHTHLCAVVELMRILVDERRSGLGPRVVVAQKTFARTTPSFPRRSKSGLCRSLKDLHLFSRSTGGTR